MLVEVSVAGIILAAGESRRMGFPKALLRYRGETFLDTLIGLFAARCEPVIVVLGAHAERIRAAATAARHFRRSTRTTSAARPLPCSAACAPCPPDAEGVLFTLVDHRPSRRPRSMRCWPRRARMRSACRVPRQGRRGHPIWFSPRTDRRVSGAARERRRARNRAQPRRPNRVPGRGRPRHPGRHRRSRGLPRASPEPRL